MPGRPPLDNQHQKRDHVDRCNRPRNRKGLPVVRKQQVPGLLAVPPGDAGDHEADHDHQPAPQADAEAPVRGEVGGEDPHHLCEQEEHDADPETGPAHPGQQGEAHLERGKRNLGPEQELQRCKRGAGEGACRQAVAKPPEVSHNSRGMIARRDLAVRVAARSDLSPTCFRLTLAAQEPSMRIPGQFGMLSCGEGFDPLLRRAFSLAGVSRKRGHDGGGAPHQGGRQGYRAAEALRPGYRSAPAGSPWQRFFSRRRGAPPGAGGGRDRTASGAVRR